MSSNRADFTPELEGYSNLKPFKFWCQKVLPAVYDDSLSYYETLCKVLDLINSLIGDITTCEENVQSLHDAYEMLENYVNTYFESLDVQEEINNKLDVMAEDGTLDSLLLPYFNQYKTEINQIVATQNAHINTAIEQQNTHIDNKISEQNSNINSQFSTQNARLDSQDDMLSDAITNQDSDILLLKNRMDTFTNLPSGSTAGDAELTDIRDGADGKTYASAGTAVRTNDNILYNMFKNVNFYDYIEKYLQSGSRSYRGVDFTWNNGEITASGTATGGVAFANFIEGATLATTGMKVGETYCLINDTNDSDIKMAVYISTDGSSTYNRVATVSDKVMYTIPSGTTHITVRADVNSGATASGKAYFHIYRQEPMGDILGYRYQYVHCTDALPTNTDLDNVIENGIWIMDNSRTYTHTPPDVSSNTGMLLVYYVGAGGSFQYFYPWGEVGIFRRRKTANTSWSAWVNIASGNQNTYNFPSYENSYTVYSEPEITTDTNSYLAPSGDTSDRTEDIATLLNTTGVCRLGKGTYVIKNLTMPEDTSIMGAGFGTIIKLDASADFAIKLNSRCIIKDVKISGKDSAVVVSETVRSKSGILWQGTYTESSANPQPSCAIIDNVYIERIEGSGISLYNTGYSTDKHLELTNCYITDCDCGINIPYWSEYHKFVNARCFANYYGCINNGGNNTFIGCDFSSNKMGFLMDNSSEQSPNNTHGTCIGCTFNHSNGNAGYGIKILNCANGFIFSGSQIFFSKIGIVDSDGIVVSDTNFGLNNCDIEIEGGGAILFANNMHQGVPIITVVDNTHVVFANCYTRDNGYIVRPS